MELDEISLPQLHDTSFLDQLLLGPDGADAAFMNVDDNFFQGYLTALTDDSQPTGYAGEQCAGCPTGMPQTTSSDTSEQINALPPGCMPLQTCSPSPFRPTAPMLDSGSPSADADSTPRSDAGGKRKRWKNRTEQQEAVHKLAQLRYREKKKAKVQNLQESAQQLKEQTAELAQLQAANDTLQTSNSFLQEQLARADAELAQLRTQQPHSNGASAGNGHSGKRGGNSPAPVASELTDDGMTWRARYAGEASYDAMKQRLQRDFKAKVDVLRDVQRRMGQGPDAVYAPEVESAAAPDQVTELRRGVAEMLETCFMLARLEGLDMQELVAGASMDGCDSLEDEGEEAELFRKAAVAIAPTPEQRRVLLKARKRWLRDIERLVADRQAINLQLIGTLLPPVVVQQPGTAPLLQAQPGDEEAKAALVQALDDNLQAEQQMWCRQDREFLGLLSPLQGAMYLTKTYPVHCDPLGLVNALFEQDGAAT